jgi:hypothetical protein
VKARWSTVLPALLSLVCAGLSLSLVGCETEAYCFSCGYFSGATSTGGPGSGGHATTSGADGGGGESTLFTSSGVGGNGGAGGSGGGCSADTENDAKNCGECGHVCDLFAAFPVCKQGQCAVASCASGHFDKNAIDSDGCEYVCTVTNGGVEACDGLDNDCNGVVDDDFLLSSDPNNCGLCGNVCNLANADAGCELTAGFPSCVVASCDPGFADLDGLDESGCEYACPVFPTTVEACNDKDDNCDGQINEGNPGGGLPCETACPNGACLGECTAGTTLCSGTTLICIPGQGPSIEVCDGKDNDCDGVIDNGYDLQTDPLNCGACGSTCTPAHAIGACAAGKCVVQACLPGYASLDGNAQNGCEYACPVSPPSAESCNGLDDDCNGVVDDPGLIAAQKPAAALCYPTAGTPCAGADFSCTGASGWRCGYGAGVEVGPDGKLAVVETKCDGIDGNCNGQIDEAFADLGTACDNGLLGACRDLGQRICDPMDVTGTKCDLSVLPNAVPGAPSAEACNGVDDDCNGLTDDGIVDDMVVVSLAPPGFRIDRYEASRPDATAVSAGLAETRRCVTANVVPWTHATYAEAATACAASGARLCTAAEMQSACQGAAMNAYPYGMSYQPLTCNGLDFDGAPGGQNDNLLLPTGAAALASCATALGIHDLSGNASEWTSTVTGNTGPPQNLAIYAAKGGSYQTPALGLTCQFSLSHIAANAILPELGFRCCHDLP